MLHIIKTYKKLFLGIIESKFNAEGFVNQVDKTDKGNINGNEAKKLYRMLKRKGATEDEVGFLNDIENDAVMDKQDVVNALNNIHLNSKVSQKRLSNEYLGDNEFLSIAKSIDTNNTGVIGRKEVQVYVKKHPESAYYITNAWNKHNGGKGISTRRFAEYIAQEKSVSERVTRTYKTIKKSTSRDPLTILNSALGRGSVSNSPQKQIEDINNEKDVTKKYIKQLKYADGLANRYEKILGTNNTLSSNIGVLGALHGLLEHKSVNFITAELKALIGERQFQLIQKKCREGGIGINKALLSTILEALLTFAISGGHTFSLQLFGIKIGEIAINKGEVVNILRKIGVKDPVNLAQVLRSGKYDTTDLKTISRIIAGKHFDGGTLRYAKQKGLESHASGFVKSIPLFGQLVWFIEKVANHTGINSKVQKKIEKFENPNTPVKERARLAQEISKIFRNQIKENKKLLQKYYGEVQSSNRDPLKVWNDALAQNDEDSIPSKDEILRSINSLEKALEKVANVATRHGVLDHRINGYRSRSEIIQRNLEFDSRYGLYPTKRLRIGKGKFGKALPENLNGMDQYLNEMKNGYIKKGEGSAISNMVSYIESRYNTGPISLPEFEQAMKKGRYLNEKGREKFKEILIKNMSRTGGGNLKILDYPIFVTKINGATVYIKQNCSNIQEVVPNVEFNIFKPEYWTVRAMITVKKYKQVHQEEKQVTEKKTGTKEVIKHGTKTIKKKVKGGNSSTPDGKGGKDIAKGGEVTDTNSNTTRSSSTGGGFKAGDNAESSNSSNDTTTPTAGSNNADVYEYVKVPYDYKIKVPYEYTITKTIKENVVKYVSPSWKSKILSTLLTLPLTFNSNELKLKCTKKGIPKNEIAKIEYALRKKVGSKGVKMRPLSKTIGIGESVGNTDSAEINSKYYTIKKGDTLSAIAKKFNTDYRSLMKKNGLKEQDLTKLKIGQKIEI